MLKNIARKMTRAVRREDSRYLYWPVYDLKNFGDWIGPYLYNKFTGDEPVLRKPSNRSLTTTFVTVGSVAEVICEDSIVWGSGIIFRNDKFWRPWRTHAVRGPYTRMRFLEQGYPCPEIYGDPGILMPLVYDANVTERRTPIGVVPHFVDYGLAKDLFNGQSSIRIIDVTDPIERVVDAIASCERVVSSSLHGLLIAHSYGIPAGWVEFSSKVTGDGVKFLDYFGSAKVLSPPEPLKLNKKTSLHDLSLYVNDVPMPDLKPLREPLMAACPFYDKSKSLIYTECST